MYLSATPALLIAQFIIVADCTLVAACRRRQQSVTKSSFAHVQHSRKYAKVLLEYMDGKKLTRRVGDERVAR
jgi:hypothetical protein